jgi:hypothetical protein
MYTKWNSLRNTARKFRGCPDLKIRIASCIFRWAKDETITLSEFAFLTKKALTYTK